MKHNDVGLLSAPQHCSFTSLILTYIIIIYITIYRLPRPCIAKEEKGKEEDVVLFEKKMVSREDMRWNKSGINCNTFVDGSAMFMFLSFTFTLEFAARDIHNR